MPDFRPPVDVEQLAVGYLKADAAVTAILVTAPDRGVSTELPKSYDKLASRRVQLFLVSSSEVERSAGHVERAVLQVNTFGRTKAEAWQLWAAVSVAMRRAPTSAFDGAVVTAVERVSGPVWSPDPPTDGPRYVSSFAWTVHPSA